MKSKRTKALAINKKTYNKVLERDNYRCAITGRRDNLECHHVLFRSLGGMGVEYNLVMLNRDIHHTLHNTKQHKELTNLLKEYLKDIYGNVDESKIKYKKYNFVYNDKHNFI